MEAWARDGLTDEQISEKMQITVSTFYEWKKKYSEISEALKRGKEVVDVEVENALYKLALQGNITAIIFWLKNRRPNAWRDKPAELHENGNEQKKAHDELINAIRNAKNADK